MHLAQQQQALAVLEEREWLARELHDSLGQVLGYVNVQAQATQALLARDQVDLACGLLERLADVARAAQADVREFIAGVRGSGDHEPGFKAAIAELLQGSLPACRKWARPRQTSEVCPPRVFGPNQLNHCTTDENFLMAFAWLARKRSGLVQVRIAKHEGPPEPALSKVEGVRRSACQAGVSHGSGDHAALMGTLASNWRGFVLRALRGASRLRDPDAFTAKP